MLRRMAAVALAGAVGGALALAGPAQATGLTQEPISVTTEVVGKCGPIILTAQWNIGSGQTDNAKLVVFDGTDVKVAGIGTPIEVGPFDKPTEVQYRVFGGGERNYDVPLWKGHPNSGEDPYPSNQAFIDAVNAYINTNGVDWVVGGPDKTNPFLRWKHLRPTKGCVTPEEPTVKQYDCAKDGNSGELVIPTQDGVVYSHQSGPVKAGDYDVKATPADGYIFNDDAKYEWKLTVKEADECPGLPDTSGVKTLPVLLGGGALLVLLGSAVLVLARRRRTAP